MLLFVVVYCLMCVVVGCWCSVGTLLMLVLLLFVGVLLLVVGVVLPKFAACFIFFLRSSNLRIDEDIFCALITTLSSNPCVFEPA